MPCVLLVLYCPVCGWKYEEKLRTLLVFAPSTCTALERKTDLVLWETVMCCGLGLVSSESTMGHNANCRGPFFFLLSCEVAFELCWLSWVVAFWSVILFQISYRLFPTLLWSSIWTVLIDLRGRILICNSVPDLGPFRRASQGFPWAQTNNCIRNKISKFYCRRGTIKRARLCQALRL